MFARQITAICLLPMICLSAAAEEPRIEISADGHEMVLLTNEPSDGVVTTRGGGVYYGSSPDWQNTLRRQVGGLQVADMNGDGWLDVVVGCYQSSSFPPYDNWPTYIYYNTGGELEANPSWISTDEVSTGDVQVADINGDTYLDIFAANGGFAMADSVIYWGSASGPSNSPGWSSNEPANAWNNYAILFDFDHDGDIDVFTANQGNSQDDPYRPMFGFINNAGVLANVPSWQSAETSIQNFLAFGDMDGDGWEDLAVSKWANFESGVYKNSAGTLQVNPVWTTGDDDTDKGVAWADVDDNGWLDLALGHDPTQLFTNNAGVLTYAWGGGATYYGHSDLRFQDVDLDGDPDLAEVHFSDGKTHIYLNNNGVLDFAPTWTYDASPVGTALGFGDINGDNWPDLVIGYSGDPSLVVFYAQPPSPVGDIDGDGDVDFDDLNLLLAAYNTSTGDPMYNPDADLDGDGDVDFDDLNLLLANYGS